MAKLIKDQEQNVVSGEFKRADAWLNVFIVDPETGERQQISQGIKLYKDDELSAALIEAGDLEGLSFQMEINVVGDKPKKDISRFLKRKTA